MSKFSPKGAWTAFWHTFWEVFAPWVAHTLEKPWLTKYDDTVPSKQEELKRKTPITYYDTAMRRPKIPSPRVANLTPGWDMLQISRLPDNTRCHEYLYSSMGGFNPYGKSRLTERRTRHEYEEDKEIDALVDFDMPAAHIGGNGGSAILVVFYFFMTISRYMFYGVSFFIPVVSLIALPFMFYSMGFINTLKGLPAIPMMIVLFCIIPLTLYSIQKLIWESRLLHKLFWSPKVHVALRRDKGVLELYKNNKPYQEIPFDEIEASLTVIPPTLMSSTITTIMSLRHSITGKVVWYNVNMGVGVGPGGECEHAIDWEIWQHFMDTSRPLPDIPQFEPFRRLDPTTIEWDKKHGRPPNYWENIDDETYEQIVQACTKAASKYPFTDEDKVAEMGWRPAGDGKHWYQLG